MMEYNQRNEEEELKHLLQDYAAEPENIDLINRIAIAYFSLPDCNPDKLDYDFFEKAYNLKKIVKSTHNFAWFLYFEWSEIEWRWNQDNAITLAMKIQLECIALEPKTYFPYYQYGYMLLDQKKYSDAIYFLQLAAEKSDRRDIIHNIGYCYFKLRDYLQASSCFKAATTPLDLENRSLFNFALTQIQLGNENSVNFVAQSLEKTIKENELNTVSGHEIGLLYYCLDNLKKCSECILMQGIDSIDFIEWREFAYAIFKTDKKLFINKVNDEIKYRWDWIQELKNDHEDWKHLTSIEKTQKLIELETEIATLRNLETEFEFKPKIDLESNYLLVEYCGCLLFDCKLHGNIPDDL